MSQRFGTYIASRASLPERSARWRRLRDEEGYVLTSSWIDEAGEGETADFGELWVRIAAEVARSERLVIYAEPGDFPLKGAFVEIGMALMTGIPIYVVLPGVKLEDRSCRPIGSWIKHPLVRYVGEDLYKALEGAHRIAGKSTRLSSGLLAGGRPRVTGPISIEDPPELVAEPYSERNVLQELMGKTR